METEGAVSSVNILGGCLRMEAVGYLVTVGEGLLYAKGDKYACKIKETAPVNGDCGTSP